MKPYYQDDAVTIYHGDCRRIFGDVFEMADVLVSDPPFGIEYYSNHRRTENNARDIRGDRGTFLRDFVLSWWEARPALLFGSAKAPRPYGVRQILIWDQGGALGMGDLALPWKHSWQEIYVCGGPWAGQRDCGSVIRCPPVQGTGRAHPNEKPTRLLQMLLEKCISGTVIDPFMGSGTTLRAAKDLGRKAIGIEIEEKYCEIAAKRMAQAVLPLEAAR